MTCFAEESLGADEDQSVLIILKTLISQHYSYTVNKISEIPFHHIYTSCQINHVNYTQSGWVIWQYNIGIVINYVYTMHFPEI